MGKIYYESFYLPVTLPIEKLSLVNTHFRTTLWTGDYLQVTLMQLLPGESIGLEMHPHLDQFIHIQHGSGTVHMGESQFIPSFQGNVHQGDAIIIPTGTWHNLTNTCTVPLKLYSVYGPPEHPKGTLHKTKADDPHTH